MFNYFIDFYVKHYYGYSFLMTDILVVLCTVFLFGKWTVNLKGLGVYLLQASLSWLAMMTALSVLYFFIPGTKAMNYFEYIHTGYLLLYLLAVSRQKFSTRVITGVLYFSLYRTVVQISEILGRIARHWWGFTVDFTPISMIFLLVGTVLLLYIFKIEKFSFLSKFAVAIELTFSVIVFVVLKLYAENATRTTYQESLVMLLVYSALYLICLIVYIFFYYVLNEYDRNMRMTLMQEKINSDAAMMKAASVSYEKLSSLRHDVRNQYSMMSYLLSEGRYDELKKYFDEYSVEFSEALDYTNCGNKVLDNILNIEKNKAKECGCNIESRIAVPPVMPFSDVDLCSLITNLLDNAIEACSGKSDSVIKAGFEMKNEYLFIKIVNPCDDLADGNYDVLPTTKGDAEKHGFGQKIIRRIVEKYKGCVTYNVLNGMFTTDVMIAMKLAEESGSDCPDKKVRDADTEEIQNALDELKDVSA